MQEIIEKCRSWLLPVLLILFILSMVTLPFAFSLSYSGPSDSPDRTLKYSPGKLVWDSNYAVDPVTGVAYLPLFSSEYNNVKSDDGENILAPGTDGSGTVRLQNTVGVPVEFRAVLYRKTNEQRIPLRAELNVSGSDSKIAEDYPLPPDVAPEDVITARKGVLKGHAIADFTVDWKWLYEEGLAQDEIDTLLGIEANEEEKEYSLGIYIVIDDYNDYTTPRTGDNSNLGMYWTLMALSLGVLVLLFRERRRKGDEPEDAEA